MLRVLIVDDSSDDVLLIVHELKMAGFRTLQHERVDGSDSSLQQQCRVPMAATSLETFGDIDSGSSIFAYRAAPRKKLVVQGGRDGCNVSKVLFEFVGEKLLDPVVSVALCEESRSVACSSPP